MDNVNADFTIQNNQLEADYLIEDSQHFDCQFEIFASGTVWGSIEGDITNQTDLQEILNSKQNTLTAGDNIQIENDIISATDTTYTAGDGISIENNVIINTRTSAEWGNITGTLSDQTDLQNALNSKQNTISDLSTIRQNAENGNSAYGTIQTYGDIVTYNAADFAMSSQGALADSALQPNDNISELVNDVGYITSASLPTVNDGKLTIQVNGTDLAEFTANQSGDTTANITIPSTTWGNISGTLSDQTDLQNALNTKPTNNATGTQSIALGQGSSATGIGSIAYGYEADATSTYSMAIGWNADANNTNTIAIGKGAKAFASGAIALGTGAENSTASTFQVSTYQLLDLSNGLIPDARISSNIARTTDIPSLANYVTTNTAQTISQTKAFSQPLVIADNNGLASGTILSNKKILQRSSGDNTLTLNNIDNKLRLIGSETRPKYSTDGTTFGELALYSDVTAIDNLIPAQASISNQLADKAFVNSTIQTNTANFRGNWTDWADVPTVATDYPADASGNKKPTVNDYMVVQDASDYTLDTLTGTWRFKYTGDWDVDGKSGWLPEYQVNETPLTQAQLDAINSGITSGDVTLIGTALQPNDNVSELVNDAGYITSSSLPTVNDATLTIQKNSTNVGTFTANASSNVTIDLSIPTDTNDLTNGAGYITNSALSGYATETWVGNQGYALSSSLATVATSGSYNDLSNKPTIPSAQVNSDWNAVSGVAEILNKPIIPTDTSDLTNGAGYITGITSSDVTTALGYIPYNSTNPNGYITSASLPTIDQTYDGTSANPQSGVAIESELTTNYQTKLVSGTSIKTINGTSLLGSGDIDTNNIFWATYGTTTHTEIDNALSAGKVVACDYQNTIYYFHNIYGTDYKFTSIRTTLSLILILDATNDTWSDDSVALQEELVSGTNIKTINNNSLLGSGNISIAVPTKISDLTDDTATYPIDKAESLVDQNSGTDKLWTGTLAEYNTLVNNNEIDNDTYYGITDDQTASVYEAYTKSEVDTLIQNALNDALYYKAGDTFSSSTILAGGCLTGDKTSVLFTIYIPKSLANINTVSINSMYVNIRGENNYIGAAFTSGGTSVFSFSSPSIYKTSEHSITVSLTLNTAASRVTNNTSISVAIQSCTLTFS